MSEEKPTTKAALRVRWVVLILACIMMIGNYYCYDNPSALQDQMKTLMMGHGNNDQFGTYSNLLYTVYSIPNVVLPFLGGFFVDKVSGRTRIHRNYFAHKLTTQLNKTSMYTHSSAAQCA